MELVATMKLALRALARNKMRSALTMLGIIIGVGAVITMVGIGQGSAQQIQQSIAAMGSNMLFIGSGSVNRGGLRIGSGATKTLVLEDVAAILRECPAVVEAAPASTTGTQVVHGNDNWGTRVTGTDQHYFPIRNWNVKAGTLFDGSQVDVSANVAVIGETVRKNLFGTADAVGQTIRIKSIPFTVIGVLTEKGQSAAMGNDQDDIVYVPITTYMKKITGETWLSWAMASAISAEASTAAQQQIESLLRDRHHIREGDDDDFRVRNLKDLADQQADASKIMTTLLASIAGVSLLVGGIGIMNIMLVSVTERTREIGIRIAIGATEADVQRQFLIEAFTLSVMGGVIGIILGIVASYLISHQAKWPVLISPASIAIAALFSMAIGIFFGFYPARKASRLDPIDALRYE